MFSILKKFFGTQQSRKVNKYYKIVKSVNEWEKKFQSLSEEEAKKKTGEFRHRLAQGESLDSLLPEAYGLVKNICRRLLGTDIHVSGYDQKWDMVPYDVQILGATAMYYGAIAEIQTGEGKTLTATMPLYLNALTGKPVHLVTVNDYLAKRDCEWVGVIFRWLGLTTAALTNDITPQKREKIYKSDIIYGTASEFGFDYLRDNSMAHSAEEQCQTGHFFAIIDEADSILIDEARTPLIISGPTSTSKQMYDELKGSVSKIVRLQRDTCNQLATEARKVLEKLGRLKNEAWGKLSKAEEAEEETALKNLWLVSKGTPQNNILTRLRENPDLRAAIEKWETYFHGDPNKKERLNHLGELYIIVDERASEFELTDKGILTWTELSGSTGSSDDFEMLDLGHEYAKIDEDTSLSEQDNLKKKVEIREYDSHRKERAHSLRQLFRAHLLMEKNIDYIVQEGKVVIIDEHTGRPQPGRRFSDGLHQSIEAKESVAIQQGTQTYATITLQNYFRMYDKLAGMTGTAITEANEFKEIYQIEVLEIPAHRKCVRKDMDDQIYMTEREKYNALVKDIQETHEKGRPILLGTESVEVSEKLSRILKNNNMTHSVLNAKNHSTEAEIIAKSGQKGAITVATNMAGRGTDIKLEEGVPQLGGLHVIGTTRHQSRRIDRQLRGRCARQGDPGTSAFYVSFEDSLLRLFTSPKLTAFIQRFRPPEGEPITAKILNKSIETAQKRVEQRNYSIRKHTLEYDDVMNMQRQEAYSFRNDILHDKNPINIAYDVLETICAQISQQFFKSQDVEGGWDPEGYRMWLMAHFPVMFKEKAFDDEHLDIDDIIRIASLKIVNSFKQKLDHEANMIASIQSASGKEIQPVSVLIEIIRNLLLRTIDRLWKEHLLNIDHLRTEVNFRVVGQKDPLMEFKHEAFILFDTLNRMLKLEIGYSLFKFETIPPQTNQFKKAFQNNPLEKFQSFFDPIEEQDLVTLKSDSMKEA